jgi:hypothetical protein
MQTAGTTQRPDASVGDWHDFEAFVRATEPRLSRALAAAYGFEDGRDATAEALAYAFEHWERLRDVENLPGYLFRVGQSRSRRRRQPVLFAVPDGSDHDFEPGLPAPQGRLTALSIWADGKGVVHRMSLTTRLAVSVGVLNPGQLPKGVHAGPAARRAKIAMLRKWLEKEAKALREKHLTVIRLGTGKSGVTTQIQLTSVTVNFLDIGHPQVITVPAHAYLTHGLG